MRLHGTSSEGAGQFERADQDAGCRGASAAGVSPMVCAAQIHTGTTVASSAMASCCGRPGAPDGLSCMPPGPGGSYLSGSPLTRGGWEPVEEYPPSLPAGRQSRDAQLRLLAGSA